MAQKMKIELNGTDVIVTNEMASLVVDLLAMGLETVEDEEMAGVYTDEQLANVRLVVQSLVGSVERTV